MNFGGAMSDGRMRIIEAAMRLLEADGPSEIKARSVAREAGGTTMSLYTHFSGIPELLKAVVDEGFRRQAEIFGLAPKGDDPMTNLYALALACRDFAGSAPHLYDLMFGLSVHGRYNNARGTGRASLGEISPAFGEVFAHLLSECEHLLATGFVEESDPTRVACQFWSALHGFVMLDLAGHLNQTQNPVTDILMPMCINLVVGMGVDRQQAIRSAALATELWKDRLNCSS